MVMRSTKLKIASLLGLISLLGAVIIAIQTPGANQYEISLYGAFPGYFWGLVVGSLLLGSLVIFFSAREPREGSWTYGLLLVVVTNLFVLLLPYIRGYQMYGRSDAMSHHGFIRDLTTTGAIGSNIYAPMHLLSIAISDATGVDPMAVGMLLPVLFSLIYFGGMYYLLVYLFDSRGQVLFALPFALLPVLRTSHPAFATYDVSIMLLPVVFYLFFKTQRKPTPPVRATFVITLFAILLYHPLTAMFLIGIFSLYFLAKYTPQVTEQFGTATNFVSLAAVIFAAWYSTYTGIIRRFVKVYESLFAAGGESSPADSYTETTDETTIELIDLLQVFTFRYGLEFLLFGLAFLFIGLVLWEFLRGTPSLDAKTVMFGGTVVLFAFGGLFFLFFDLIVPHERPWQIAKIAAVILIGQFFAVLSYRMDRKRWSRFRPVFDLSLVLLLAVLLSLTTIGMHQSPAESEANHQMTEMEIEGGDWLMENGQSSDQIMQFQISQTRLQHAAFGVDTEPAYTATTPPPHFNYTEHEYLGDSVDGQSYLTLNRYGRITYPEQFENYPENWRYTPSDFERLELDVTTDRIYDNGDYNQYFVEES